MHWGQNQYFHPDARNFRLCTTSFLLRTPHFFFKSARHEGLRTNDRKQSKILKRGRPPRDPGGIWQWHGTGSSHGVYQRRPTQQIRVTCQPAAESVESSIRHRHRPVIIIIIIIIIIKLTTDEWCVLTPALCQYVYRHVRCRSGRKQRRHLRSAFAVAQNAVNDAPRT